MSQVPFQVVCTSCESILEVRNAELVGQIVACPKCGSMVMLTAQQPVPVEPQHVSDKPELPDILPDVSSTVSPKPENAESPSDAESPFAQTPEQDAATDNTDNVESLGPLAAELQAKYLRDLRFEDWQGRRLALVAVGTCCLLAVFVAFLLLKPDGRQAASGDDPAIKQPLPAPIPPDGIEKTRTTGDTSDDTTNDVKPPPTVDANSGGLPLPPADQIDDDTTPGTTPPDSATDTTSTDTPVDTTSSTDGTQPGAVRVAPLHQGGGFVDPFAEYFDQPDDDGVRPPYDWGDSTGDTQTQNGTGPTSENDGFSGMLDDPSNITDPGTGEGTGGNIGGNDGGELGIGTLTRPDIGVEPGDIMGTLDSLKQNLAVTTERVKLDIDGRLQQPVTSIRFERAAIIDVIRAISDLSGVPMQLDVDQLRARGIGIESPISLQLQDTTLAGVIEAVSEKTRLLRHDGDDCIVFGYPDEQSTATRTFRYDMSQLAALEQNPISTEQAAQWLSQLLLDQPQNPYTRGAAVSADENEVVVVGTIWLQDQARRLLLTLFYLREIEPETKLTPERLAPEVFGWDRVNTPLSFNPVEAMPLKQAANLIERHTKLRLLIDHAALHEAAVSQKTPVTCHVSHGTIDTVLREMLEPLGLTYRIVEANAVEITTPNAARHKMTIEAQHYAPLPAGKTPESIAETMRQVFGGNTGWHETGGVIVIDTLSGYMLVRQSQPLQRDIRLWFGRMHTEEDAFDDALDDNAADDVDDAGIEIDVVR